MMGSTCCPTVELETETTGVDHQGSYFLRKDLPNVILIKLRNRRLVLKERCKWKREERRAVRHF